MRQLQRKIRLTSATRRGRKVKERCVIAMWPASRRKGASSRTHFFTFDLIPIPDYSCRTKDHCRTPAPPAGPPLFNFKVLVLFSILCNFSKFYSKIFFVFYRIFYSIFCSIIYLMFHLMFYYMFHPIFFSIFCSLFYSKLSLQISHHDSHLLEVLVGS